jgi:putative flippase GtrA
MTPTADGDDAGIAARLVGVGAAHAGKGLRYMGVSVINVVFGQVLLIGAYSLIGWDAVPSQVFAALVGSVPAYLLCRAWVWKVDGVISFTREILPFWGLALLGLMTSVMAVDLAANWAEGRWGVGGMAQLAVTAASLGAFGIVWVIKYVVLDQLLFASDG